MFKSLMQFFKPKTEKQKIDEYLADSISIEDVENRIRMLEKGQAPWQLHAKAFSQGWAL